MEQTDLKIFLNDLWASIANTDEMRQRLTEKLLEMGKADLAQAEEMEFNRAYALTGRRLLWLR